MIDKLSYVPLSRQVYDIICSRIMSGIYKEESTLPSQQLLAKEFDVSMITVRQAFKDLNEKKIIVSKRGIGSIVIKSPEIYRGKHTVYGFTVDSRVEEYKLKSENINIHPKYKCLKASYKLEIATTEPVFINRLRYVNNKKVSLEFSYLNPLLLKNINWKKEFQNNMSLYRFIFNKHNYQVIKAEESIFQAIPEKKIRDQLDLKKTDLTLFIKRLTFVKNEKKPIEYCEYYILPEYYGKIVYSVENKKNTY